MTMTKILLLLAWVISQGQGQLGQDRLQCGGMFTARQGIIQTPHFPHKFPVPLRCRWVIDVSLLAADNKDISIVVYFTQLFVTSGLRFTEFDYYEQDSTFQLGGREIHRVTEQNVTSVQWILSHRHYLVLDFQLDRLEGNHLRVLDNLLDVYGFNMTYEVEMSPKNNSCSVVRCSLSGHCYVSQDFKNYSCNCFPGFSGPYCSKGPLCQPTSSVCENGATCRQVGATVSTCVCAEGFTGGKCEVRLTDQECTEGDSCTLQCPEDNSLEPCGCGHRGTPIINDRARYEGTLRLSNVTYIRKCLENDSCSLKPTLTKQITKYLRSSNLSIMEDLQVIDVSFSGEVRFHFWGDKREGSKVRESLNKLVQKGKLGNMTLVITHLAITQEPTLRLQSVRVNHHNNQVRQGDPFVLSCIAQGSSHLSFRWFKDGVSINITRSKRTIWSRLLPLDSSEQYTALLGVERSDPLDQGRFTCQVVDWGYQQCRSVVLEILREPQVRLDPLSITVEKGENITVKCMSPNELQNGKFGYSWTKNNALFKMTPGQEFWEDLYPGGSLLRVYNVQRSATYSCHVHGSVRSVSRSMRLEMLNQSAVPWCPTDETGVGGIRWDRTGPGVVSKVECPAQYSGVATRLCLLVEQRQALWQTPDFSGCRSDKIVAVTNNFLKVTLGFGNSSAVDAVFGVLTSLRDRGVIYPGEGEPAIALVNRVASYINETGSVEELANGTNYFYSVINTLLLHRNSLFNHQKVEELHQTVNMWTALWALQTGTGSAHIAYESLVVDLFRYQEPTFRQGQTITIPRPTQSYPPWFSSRVSLNIDSNKLYQNSSTGIGVIVYHKLTDFLPLRYSQVLHNGSEVQYEVVSDLVTVVVQGPLGVIPSLELKSVGRPGWESRCGVTNSPTTLWNITVCRSIPILHNRTACRCPQLGTFGVLLVKVIHTADLSSNQISPSIVLLGCACCFTQTLLTLVLLLLRWSRHHTWLLFLKVQCCASTLAVMIIFLYAFSRSLPEKYFNTTSNTLQAIILVSLSSHLGKVLMVYTEVVYLPNVHHLKQTIIAVMYGGPVLVVLCNHMSQVSLDTRGASWWLSTRTTVFYTSSFCGLLLVLLFTFLYIHVSKTLRSFTNLKNMDTKRTIYRRQGLLHRSAVVFSGTVTMVTSSVMYINYPTVTNQYLFTLNSALLGFFVLVCYVLHSESPLHIHVLSPFTLHHVDSSETDSSPLSIFTKQEADVECEGMPTREETILGNGTTNPTEELTIKDQDVSKEGNTHSRSKGTSPKERIVTVSEKVSKEEHQVAMEVYPGSPRRIIKESQEAVTSTRVCVITSVVVDTPSVVVCSVDVEPCSVLNKSIVSSGEMPSVVNKKIDLEECPSQNGKECEGREEENELVGDVMDRICDDLNYLLGGVEVPPEITGVQNTTIQNTNL